jgi:hypothetical protein
MESQIQNRATVHTLALNQGGIGAINLEKERAHSRIVIACNLNVIDGSKGRLPAQ